MKRLICSVTGVLAIASACAEEFRAPVEVPVEHVQGFLWVEAEGFAEYRSWRVDTQFTHKMGSAYLICPGADKPTDQPAKTQVKIPRAGTWRAWVRTKDWLPEFSPGKFALEVGGRRGVVLGASKKGWGWEKAGDFELPASSVELVLRDLSGAYARCDAVLLTTDLAYVPKDDDPGGVERRRFKGEPATVSDGGTFDVVVVGAGPGGMGASLGAARNGARVALVFDRPVPGGNASTECGIGFDGASLGHKNARESGVVEEIRLTRVWNKTSYTGAFEEMARKSPELSMFRNERVMRVEMDGRRIAAVVSRNTLTGRWTRWRGRLFVDSTGDGWIGYFAGARTMYGREAGSEYGEEWIAPKTADKLTMSGTLTTGMCRRTDSEQPYETPAWARILPAGFDRKVPGLGRPWWLEAPGRIDDVEDPEAARDHLIRICFAYWGYLRNEWPGGRARGVSRCAFTPPSIFNGRREGMRIVGDYVLTANDCKSGRIFPDRVTYGGWSLDTHDPLGMDNPHGDGWWHPHMGVPIYTVPFRSLYSADVPNLLLGSRCQSMTHIALGSMRVQGTQMAAGQAAGTAAALCIRHGVTPRELGKTRIGELQQQLLKDDHYIPGILNEDPLDLARGAKVTATSDETEHTPYVSEGRKNGDEHELNMPRATCFPRWKLDRLEKIDCILSSSLAVPKEITLRVYGMDAPVGDPAERTLLATVKGVVPARVKAAPVSFAFAEPLELNQPYVWVEMDAAKGVKWSLRDASRATGGCRAWYGKQWKIVKGEEYAIATTPALAVPVMAGAACVLDGVSRPEGRQVHGWISSPDADLPQSLRLDFPKPVKAHEVRIVFDSDLTPKRIRERMPGRLVKSYVVEGLAGGEWRPLARDDENFLRHRIHAFPETEITALRVTVTATWGDPSARIFEIRVY